MDYEYMIEVTESNFEYEVIAFSQNTPVVVDFWAPWDQKCKQLDPILQKLVMDAGGGLRLARLNVDENPNLVLRFSVRNIPTVKAFSDEKVVAEFVGILPEPRIREFIQKIPPPSPSNLAIKKADSLFNQHQWKEAEKMYRDVLEQSPEHPAALLGVVKTLIMESQAQDAGQIIRNFPASSQFSNAHLLLPLAKAIISFQEGTLPDKTDLDATFKNNIRLIVTGNIMGAMDGLLEILRLDRHYANDQPRIVFLGLLEMLGNENPQTRQYRQELATVLF